MAVKRISSGSGEFEGEVVILQIPFAPIFAVCKLSDRDLPLISREVEPIMMGDLKTYQGKTYRCTGKSSALILKGTRAQDFKPTYFFESIE